MNDKIEPSCSHTESTAKNLGHLEFFLNSFRSPCTDSSPRLSAVITGAEHEDLF